MFEIELKYQIAETDGASAWLTSDFLDDHYIITPADPPRQSVRDDYLDTLDYVLVRHGYAARRRTKSGETVLTVKSIPIATRTGRAGDRQPPPGNRTANCTRG